VIDGYLKSVPVSLPPLMTKTASSFPSVSRNEVFGRVYESMGQQIRRHGGRAAQDNPTATSHCRAILSVVACEKSHNRDTRK
jgi:hypothetical protein